MNADLHAAIIARLDELEQLTRATAEGAGGAEWRVGPAKRCECCNSVLSTKGVQIIATDDRMTEHIATWDPATVLRGLAEDRDILARHASDKVPANSPSLWSCEACSHDGDPGRYVDWPCLEVLSLARRHGIEGRRRDA